MTDPRKQIRAINFHSNISYKKFGMFSENYSLCIPDLIQGLTH